MVKIPSDWQISTVGDALKICNNLRQPLSIEERKRISGIYPYYGPTGILDYINSYKLEGKYVLISEDGDHFLKYKTVPMTLLVDGKFNVNNHAHILQGSSFCTREWFYYYYLHRSLFKHITRQGAGRYKLTKKSLVNLPIPLPSLPEQKEIAEILSTWDNAIETTQKLIDAKIKLKKGLMQQLLTGKKRFKGFGKPVKTFKDLPDGWRSYKIKEFASEVSVRNKDENGNTVLSCTKYNGFVNSLDYFGKKVFSEDTSNYKVIKKNQFGYPANHIEEGSIGLLLHVESGVVSPIYTVFSVDEKIVNQNFLYAVFKTERYRHIFAISTSSSVDRRGSLRWKQFSLITVYLPSLKEQNKICSILNEADCEVVKLNDKLRVLKEQKKGLMQLLLTGKIRVKVA